MGRYWERGRFSIDAGMKEGLDEIPFEKVPPPPEAVVFLRQQAGPLPQPIVREGAKVQVGQVLALGDHPLSTPVHSPVTGKVMGWRKLPHPVSGEAEEALIVKTEDDADWEPSSTVDFQSLSPEEIIGKVRQAGVVGLGGAAFPTHAKLTSGRGAEYLIINAKESDLNVACDVRLMKEQPELVHKGIQVIARALGAPQVIVALRTKPGELARLEALLKANEVEVVHLRPSYSLGSERVLIAELLGIEVPLGQYPPEVGVVVQNVSTAFAVAEAVMYGKPLIARGITFLAPPNTKKNLWVRVGTPVVHILQHLGLKPTHYSRFVMGSLFMGSAFADAAVPTVKATAAVTAFADGADPYSRALPCIRCGYCDRVCPVRIYPSLILAAVQRGNGRALSRLRLEACIECGLCSYVCPARIRFTSYLRAGKEHLRSTGGAKPNEDD